MIETYSVLLVEDTEAHVSAIRRSFATSDKQINLSVVSNVEEALNSLYESKPDLMVLDLVLPDGAGLDLLPGDRDKADFPIIVLTAHGDEQAAVEAMKRGAMDYLAKSKEAFDQILRVAERSLNEWDNIVKRKEAEAALAAEKERLAVTLRSIGDGVISADAQGRIVSLNPAAEKLTGWTEKEAEGKLVEQIFCVVDGQTGERCQNPLQKILGTGHSAGFTTNTVLITKNGKEHLLACNGSPIYDNEGNVVEIVLVFRDATDLRHVQEALEASEARYGSLFDSMDNAVAVYSVVDDGNDFVFLDFNKAGESIENVSKDELIGKSVQKMFPGVNLSWPVRKQKVSSFTVKKENTVSPTGAEISS